MCSCIKLIHVGFLCVPWRFLVLRINDCIRFDDRSARKAREERDKLAPIREVFERWVQCCKKCYNPGGSVTIDEEMVPFRGKCPFRQYMKAKPDPYGIKVWVCWDAVTAYAWNSQVYVGRDRNCKPEVKQGQRVVLELTDGLEGRNITCDNFFTSHELATELKKRKQTILGTIRKNRVEIPPIILDMKKKSEFHSQFVFDHKLKATMVSYVPKKGRFVCLLSTFVTDNTIDNGKKKKPEIILRYNKEKGAVDTLDKLVGTYRSKRKCQRWPMALFSNILDVSAVNAFIIFTELNPEWNTTKKLSRRRIFIKEVGRALTEPLILSRQSLPRGRNSAELVKRARKRNLDEMLDPSPSTSHAEKPGRLSHTPPAAKRARCHLCVSSKSNLHSARCDKCKNHVCPLHKFQICESCEKIMNK